MAKISIIIPVYNTEQYLKECIESILLQDYKDFEAIFVDDGSQDASYSIINKFVNRDERIKLYHQNNAGVSAARNLGLKYAKGDYIAFIDSDDIISPNYLDRLYQCAIQYRPDIVLSGIVYMRNGDETGRVALTEGALSLKTEVDLIHFFKTPLLTSPVSKLYKRQIICDNNIQFDTSISFAEDKDFNLQYFQHIQDAHTLSYCGYLYRDVETSLSHRKYEYRYRIEHKHWGVKRGMLESLQDYGSKGECYLTNQLFYLIYDEMSDIAHDSQSIKDMMNKWEKSVRYVDFDYLTRNRNLLNQPLWMKMLLKMSFYRIIFMILSIKMKRHGKATC